MGMLNLEKLDNIIKTLIKTRVQRQTDIELEQN